MKDTIYLKDGGGPVYTKADENMTMINDKAFAFLATWGIVYGMVMDAEYETKISALTLPSFFKNEDAWAEILKFYKDDKMMRWAKKMHGWKYEADGKVKTLDLLICDEDDVRAFLQHVLFDSGQVKATKAKYVKSGIVSPIRCMFRAIGREHAWGDNKDEKLIGNNYIKTGNPMTTATEDAMVAKLVTKHGKKKDRHGVPISVAAGFANMIHLLVLLVKLMGRWEKGIIKDASKIVNIAMLIMMYALQLHEGSRPGNTQLELRVFTN